MLTKDYVSKMSTDEKKINKSQMKKGVYKLDSTNSFHTVLVYDYFLLNTRREQSGTHSPQMLTVSICKKSVNIISLVI